MIETDGSAGMESIIVQQQEMKFLVKRKLSFVPHGIYKEQRNCYITEAMFQSTQPDKDELLT
jgi:hypothetical protein